MPVNAAIDFACKVGRLCRHGGKHGFIIVVRQVGKDAERRVPTRPWPGRDARGATRARSRAVSPVLPH